RRSLQAHQRPVRASRRGCGAARGGAADRRRDAHQRHRRALRRRRVRPRAHRGGDHRRREGGGACAAGGAQRARRDRQVGNGDRDAVDRGGGRGARAGHARLQGAGGTADGGGGRGALPGEERRAQPHRDVAERGHVGLIPVIALLLACAFFLLIHFGVSGTRLRDALVARLGEGPYRGVFALASLVGLLWMIRAYSHAPVIELWGKLPRLRPVALAVVFVGVLLVVVGLASANPTSVGMEGRLARGAEGVRGIKRTTRPPYSWGRRQSRVARIWKNEVNGHKILYYMTMVVTHWNVTRLI